MGRGLLQDVIDHYKKLGDVQMVAMLASVFSQPWPDQCQLKKEVNSAEEKPVELKAIQNTRLRFNSENLDDLKLPLQSLRTSSEGDTNGNDYPLVHNQHTQVHNQMSQKEQSTMQVEILAAARIESEWNKVFEMEKEKLAPILYLDPSIEGRGLYSSK